MSTPSPEIATSLLDRAAIFRTDQDALRRLWEHPDARRLAMFAGELATADDGPPGLVQQPRLPDPGAWRRVLLGVDESGSPWWLVRLRERPPLPGGYSWRGLRELGPSLSGLEMEVMATAVALESWHYRHGFCPRCGQDTKSEAAGWVRRCPRDGSEHYPRTDPAIIVLVQDEHDRALLARQSRWPPRWMSTLAGFVEPGEPAESAVRREVAEEVGLALGAISYVRSQPWPFPGSLMLGFHAWATHSDFEVDGVEIAQARWFTREQLASSASAGEVLLPPSISIARSLIERWYGKPLPGGWLRG